MTKAKIKGKYTKEQEDQFKKIFRVREEILDELVEVHLAIRYLQRPKTQEIKLGKSADRLFKKLDIRESYLIGLLRVNDIELLKWDEEMPKKHSILYDCADIKK